VEPNETVLVELHSPSYGRLLAPNPSAITGRDDPSTVSAAAQSVFLAEPDDGHLDQGVPFLLSLPVTADTQIPILIEPRGATPEVDFLMPALTVTVPAGARSFVVPVRVFADALEEPVESFSLRLGNSDFTTPRALRMQVNLLDRLLPGRGTELDGYQLPQNVAFSAGAAGDPAPGVAANDPGLVGTVRLSHSPNVGTLALNPSGSFKFTPPVNFIGQARFAYEGRLDGGLGPLVEGTATWKYLHPRNGVDPAVAQSAFNASWMTVGFDDAAWSSGTACSGMAASGPTTRPRIRTSAHRPPASGTPRTSATPSAPLRD